MHLRTTTLVAALLAAVAPCCAYAQDAAVVEVRPGSALVDASRLAAHTDTFAMTFENGSSALLVIRTALLGDSALLRVERIVVGAREVSADSFAARRPRLEPLYDDAREPSSTHHFTFPPGRVFGKTTPLDGGAPRPVSVTLTPPAFYANTSDLLLASLPLREGSAFNVSMWSPGNGPYVLRARVVRAETVPTLEGGRCEAWRIEAEEANDRSVYWVEKRSQALLAYTSGPLQLRIVRHAACRAGDATRRAER